MARVPSSRSVAYIVTGLIYFTEISLTGLMVIVKYRWEVI